jgi:hypothetical protein
LTKIEPPSRNDVIGWALPRLAGYVGAALVAVLALTIWAIVYTSLWPGQPPTWI